MRKKIIVILTMVLCVSLLSGCMTKEEVLSNEVVQLESEVNRLNFEIEQLTKERDALMSEVIDIKIDNGTTKYIVTFNIKQSHFTLDIGQHLKDEMNDISIQIPVDKEYYDSVQIGDTIADDFRVGSLIMKGSFGNWNVTVEDKTIE